MLSSERFELKSIPNLQTIFYFCMYVLLIPQPNFAHLRRLKTYQIYHLACHIIDNKTYNNCLVTIYIAIKWY
jgi:hypothetical protein